MQPGGGRGPQREMMLGGVLTNWQELARGEKGIVRVREIIHTNVPRSMVLQGNREELKNAGEVCLWVVAGDVLGKGKGKIIQTYQECLHEKIRQF